MSVENVEAEARPLIFVPGPGDQSDSLGHVSDFSRGHESHVRLSSTYRPSSFYLRSFSVLSEEDSDFEDLPDFALDIPDGDVELFQSSDDHRTAKEIPFTAIHNQPQPFTTIRQNCWIPRTPISVKIISAERNNAHTKILNPNLYTIQIKHGEFQWQVRRRYKHFVNLHQSLKLFRMRHKLPVPTKTHRERRQSLHGRRVPRFPKKPDILVRTERDVDKRKRHLEDYLKNLINITVYQNHMETLKFLEVSHMSFVKKLGKKWKEGAVMKCSGGRRISIGCCGCLKKFHFAGRWNKRWLIIKDSFVAYVRPRDGMICDVMLMDQEFKVENGFGLTGASHGLMISNLTRNLLAKCWTGRKADEWQEAIENAAKTTGLDYTQPNRFHSFAPVRESSYAKWFVDGSNYFSAVAEALENAQEEIFITDWWLSPEIYLKRPITEGNKWRLDKILERKANQGVKIFILLYKEMTIALNIQSIYSKHTLTSKNPENIKVLRHPDHGAGGVLLWAHHEKIVAIDQKIAFLGGFDLCYGRWDDPGHRLEDLGCIVYDHTKQSSLDSDEGNKHDSVFGDMTDTLDVTGIAINVSPPTPERRGSQAEPIEVPEAEKSNTDDSDTGSKEENCSECICRHSKSGNGHSYDNNSLEESEAQTLLNSESKGIQKSEDTGGINNQIVSVTVHRNNSGSFDSIPKVCVKDQSQNSAETSDTSLSDTEGRRKSEPKKSHLSELTAEYVDNYIEKGSMQNLNRMFVKRDSSESQNIFFLSAKEARDSLAKKSQKNLKNHEASEEINMQDNDQNTESKKSDSDTEINLCSQTQNAQNEKESHHMWDKSKLKKYSSFPFSKEKILDTSRHSDNTEVQLKGFSKLSDKSDNQNSDTGQVQLRLKIDTTQSDSDKLTNHNDSNVASQNTGVSRDSATAGDKTTHRESWAMRKLRKSLSRMEENNNTQHGQGADDVTDGDRSAAQNRWKLVLNVQKFQSAVKLQQQQTPLPVEKSPLSPKLSTRIKNTISEKLQHQMHHRDSITDILENNKLGAELPAKLLRTTSEIAIEELGLKGSTKFWIGKDYVNFIQKDFVDLQSPFEDFIDRYKTPRMPWHDIGAVVYGKAARDVSRHFIGRWNFTKVEKVKNNKDYPLLLPKSYGPHNTVSAATRECCDEVKIQILRSASGWSAGIQFTEKSIMDAYIHCIESAKHYIYIENQFFITHVGDHSIVKNEIGDALYKRILRAHRNGETFRVFVVMPLLPAFEGDMGAGNGFAIRAITHYNYTSISKGPTSLWDRLSKEVIDPLKYIVFCGLRTHAELSGNLVSELVYVHSKLLIVDDDTAIIGSANINDRSMLGDRDSEIAVMVQDIHKTKVMFNGVEHRVGNFASSLRKTLFREHLGLKKQDPLLEDPVCDNFYKNVLLRQATINTTVFQRVFHCVPTDLISSFAELDSYNSEKALAETDPDRARQELNKVKGYIVLIPLHFMEKESKLIPAVGKEAFLPNAVWI